MGGVCNRSALKRKTGREVGKEYEGKRSTGLGKSMWGLHKKAKGVE